MWEGGIGEQTLFDIYDSILLCGGYGASALVPDPKLILEYF